MDKEPASNIVAVNVYIPAPTIAQMEAAARFERVPLDDWIVVAAWRYLTSSDALKN